jgi:phosphatidylglycerol:prolipoprotein diacylglycerol transferase
MHPLLFKIGPLSIHTYGLMIALGFFAALTVVRRIAPRSGMSPDFAVDTAFWLLLVGFIGARSLFVLTRFDEFLSDPFAVFKIWEGGLVFFGGPLAALPWGYWWLRKHKLSFWKAIDTFIPGLVLGHAMGRLGCLAAGCCYGRPTDSTWGVKLNSDLVDPAFRGIPLHPVQLYESAALFVLFVGLLWIHKNKKFDGQVGISYMLIYPVIRSIVETFRGDLVRGFVIDGLLSTSQFISILFMAAGLILLSKRLHESRQGSLQK